jgi:hypothetical protein
MDDYRARASFLAVMAASLALAGCAKPAVEVTPLQAAPEQAAPEQAAPEQAAQNPVPQEIELAQQAATIAGYIDERPECAAYREQLEAANTAATSAELVAVLEKAHKAGCSRNK